MQPNDMAALRVNLDIAKSHSRPHVSADNRYSVSQYKTMKYRPDFPARIGCIEGARAHCQTFLTWYNTEHRHSGIGYMTPGNAISLYGLADLQREKTHVRPVVKATEFPILFAA